MSQALQPVRGTHDLLAEDYAKHQHVIRTAQDIAGRYGYASVDTPIFEFSEVFHRTLGDTSDIVTKETYTFPDRGGDSLTLRPEFTAGIARAFISNGLQQHVPWKCFYAGPAFRYERPQKGRLRQFHQIGAELLGATEPEADVELIALGMNILETLGLKQHVKLEVNSLGDTESRQQYRTALVAYLQKHADSLSTESRTRLEKNPLRVLDSKDEQDRAVVANAPKLSDHFNEHSREFFAAVQAGLETLGINFVVSPTLVRGLDYYSHTVFEVTTQLLGAQNAVLAGGRYDGLVKLMGGTDTPGIGWAAGVERLAALVDAAGTLPAAKAAADIAVVPVQDSAEAAAWQLAQDLRRGGFNVEIAYKGKTGKRLARADKLGCRVALMLGDDEVKAGTVTVKDLKSGTQETLAREQLEAKLGTIL